MTTADELEEMRHERDAYLLALYDLTKDSELRWATHREVSNRAGIDESRVMVVSHNLHQRNFVQIRTMGGIDGYVELTSLGAEEAERLIGTNSITRSAPPSSQYQEVLEAGWFDRYQPLVRMAFESFAKDGSWPALDPIQRALDQQGSGIDARQAMAELPRAPGEIRPMITEHATIPLRLLRHLPEAAPVLRTCVILAQRAVELYFSDADVLQITSDDQSITLESAPEAARTAARILMSDYPNPFAGGSVGPDGSWSLFINGAVARRFRDINSIDTYVMRQLDLRQEGAKQLNEFSEAAGTPLVGYNPEEVLIASAEVPERAPSIFVVMPFEPDWSTGIYDFIKRAVRSLDLPDERVIRADAITQSGRIDQQILQAIQNADAVVGDITDCNPNVMWELGYAEAAKIPVVILNQRIGDSPFDLANVRQVLYRLAPTDDDEAKLARHIRTALDEGAPTSNEPKAYTSSQG